MARMIKICIDLSALRLKENEKVAEKINKILVDLQRLSVGDLKEITLQKDDRYVRVSTADYKTQGGHVQGLGDAELDILKDILGVSESGTDESEDCGSEDTYETTVFKTQIPTVEYVVASWEGPWHGMNSEVYLRYAPPPPTAEGVRKVVGDER